MGLQFKEIAEEFHITTTALQQWRKDNGYPICNKNNKKWGKQNEKFASAGLSILVATGVAGIGEMKYRQQNKRNQKHLKTVLQNNRQWKLQKQRSKPLLKNSNK